MLEKIGLKEVIDRAQELQKAGRYDDSMSVISQVIGQHPDNPYLMYVYANCLMFKGDFGLAMVLLKAAINKFPEFAEAYNNISVCYRREYNIEAAREAGLKAIELRKGWADPYNNLAGTCVNEGCPAMGIKWADSAVELTKAGTVEHAKTRWNRALMLLEMGKFDEGFSQYRYGIDCGERPRRNYHEDKETPLLGDLDSLKPDHTIVVYGEQGMGDEIMFASMLPDLIKVGCKVILDCHPRLVTLFARAFPEIEIHGTRKREKLTWPLDMDIDWCMPIGGLGALFRRDGKFPQDAYLKSYEDVSQRMHNELSDGRPIIGIAWSGGTKKTNNRYRCIDSELIELLVQDKNYKFVSLEYTNDGYMPEGVESSWEITQNYNYDLTACLVDACDAIVSVNTSVVHLAGALGKRVFTLTPSKPARRYGVEGDKMVWYKDVHQYRQLDDDWNTAINLLKGDLELWANLSFQKIIGS